MVQSWAYGEAKRLAEGWDVQRLIVRRDGEAVAICQVLAKRVMGFRVASRINRGPLFLTEDEEVIVEVLRTIRMRWKNLRGGLLLVAPSLLQGQKSTRLMRLAGFRQRRRGGWSSAYLDLTLDAAQLRKNLASKWRGHLNASERSGLSLHISTSKADVEWILSKHAQSMSAKGYVGPSVMLLRELRRATPSNFIVFKATLDKQPVAGLVVYQFAHSAEYYIGWYGPEGRKARAGYFLVWNAMLEMQQRGTRIFDLGGYSSAEAYGHFKQRMRGLEYTLADEWYAF